MHYKTAAGIQKIANQLKMLRKLAEKSNDPRETGELNDGQMIGTFGDKNPKSYFNGKYVSRHLSGRLADGSELRRNRGLQLLFDPLYNNITDQALDLYRTEGDKYGREDYIKRWFPIRDELKKFYRESSKYNIRKYLNKGKDIGPFKFDFKYILDPVEQERLYKLQPTITRNNRVSSNTAIG